MTQAQTAKAIVLFSDGTGNSSAKLFKTNVWRMYEAVDLGPPQEDDGEQSDAGQNGRKQIAFYDNGVGTSGLKPIAALGAVFGVGLKRNVLDIYRYACRNYDPGPRPEHQAGDQVDEGDYIYGFGFSRGAFTMRLAIALIANQGLVRSGDEAELQWKSEEAWREFRAKYLPRRWGGITRLGRAIGAAWRRLSGKTPEPYDASRNLHPVIQFVGVWDTVSAYGGPITEITRAIDNWIVRLTMFDHKLNPKVRCARQALSIDDERDAFRPILWDEIAEKDLIAQPNRAERPWLNENRLEQVWFTGMHADVGGGYPDESLSFVSFLWMMEEAKKARLRPVPMMVKHFRALASSDGPIHDSRSGVGSYYRYQPRKIGAWLEPIDPSTFAQRDPDLTCGLIETVKIHESVAARIANGTDRYAPITLPASLKVVPPQAEGETKPEAEPELPAAEPGPQGQSPVVARATEVKEKQGELIDDELRRRIEDPGRGAARVAAMEPVWRLVAWRRFLYFATLTFTLLLFTMPMWIGLVAEKIGPPFSFTSGHGLVATLIAALAGILPAFLTGLIVTWAENPFYFLFLLVGILAARGIGTRVERRLRDSARKIWDKVCTEPLAPQPKAVPVPDAANPGPPKPGRADDNGTDPTPWQRFARWTRWSLLPLLFGMLFLLVALWLILVATARVTLAVRERSGDLCDAATGGAPELMNAKQKPFDTRETCQAFGASVKMGETYIVDFDLGGPWKDGDYGATPAGLPARALGFAGFAGAPLRRAAGANYLQPMVHIRKKGDWAGPTILPLKLIQQGSPRTRWRGTFVAPRDGELSLFANEAVPPFALPIWTEVDRRKMFRWYAPKSFYKDKPFANRGSAQVTIVHAAHVVEEGRVAPPNATAAAPPAAASRPGGPPTN